MCEKRVMLVEDDPNIGFVTSEYLTARGYQVKLLTTAAEAMKALTNFDPQICVLDVNLPDKRGFELASELRLLKHSIPIIFLTAMVDLEDVKYGFSVGADDYIRKPFSAEELILRIEAILNRTTPANSFDDEIYQLGKFEFNPRERQIVTEEDVQTLSLKESELLLLLVQNINKTLDRTLAVQKIWGADAYVKGRTLDVHISKLRKYLDSDHHIEIINTRGMGYKLVIK